MGEFNPKSFSEENPAQKKWDIARGVRRRESFELVPSSEPVKRGQIIEELEAYGADLGVAGNAFRDIFSRFGSIHIERDQNRRDQIEARIKNARGDKEYRGHSKLVEDLVAKLFNLKIVEEGKDADFRVVGRKVYSDLLGMMPEPIDLRNMPKVVGNPTAWGLVSVKQGATDPDLPRVAADASYI